MSIAISYSVSQNVHINTHKAVHKWLIKKCKEWFPITHHSKMSHKNTVTTKLNEWQKQLPVFQYVAS